MNKFKSLRNDAPVQANEVGSTGIGGSVNLEKIGCQFEPISMIIFGNVESKQVAGFQRKNGSTEAGRPTYITR